MPFLARFWLVAPSVFPSSVVAASVPCSSASVVSERRLRLLLIGGSRSTSTTAIGCEEDTGSKPSPESDPSLASSSSPALVAGNESTAVVPCTTTPSRFTVFPISLFTHSAAPAFGTFA
uniref:Putative secreted protein n=1 Tax=Anopheles darlingi TaxID=43151 RepID=A0A2M4DFR1_ANODA